MKRTLAAEPPSPVERSRRKPRTHRRPRRTHSHRISSSLFESYLCSPVSRRLLCRRRHSPSSSPPLVGSIPSFLRKILSIKSLKPRLPFFSWFIYWQVLLLLISFQSMFFVFNKPAVKTIKKLFGHFGESIISFDGKVSVNSFLHIQRYSYVNVYMKWKKDSYYDSIEDIHQSILLKPIIALKNCIARDPNECIPISDVSKRGLQLDVPMKVARFMRQYPSIFEEFTGPQYNLPWFRLTPEAAEIDKDEKRVYKDCREDLQSRLKKMILMTRENVLPLKIIQGMQWYLGLPDDFLQYPERNLDDSFKFVEMEGGLKALAVERREEIFSVMEENAMRKGLIFGGTMEAIEFPLFPSKGLRLRTKIQNWIDEFQKLPYISPYDDFSNLDPNSDIAEKRLIGVLHELLSLFVEHSAERKKLFCLKKYFGLPQKMHRAFERHPHMFYLSFRNNTCSVILKEAYSFDRSAFQKHPLLGVRKKYIKLMKKSQVILKNRRVNNRFSKSSSKQDLDSDNVDKEEHEIAACSAEQVV